MHSKNRDGLPERYIIEGANDRLANPRTPDNLVIALNAISSPLPTRSSALCVLKLMSAPDNFSAFAVVYVVTISAYTLLALMWDLE